MKISNKFHLEDINKLKNTVLSGKTEDIKWRIKQINIVSKLLDENKKEIIKSLFIDLGKSEIEGMSEILLVKEEISLIKKRLNSWMRPKKVDTPFYLFPSSSKVIHEPLGCVLILSPYNYPLLYVLKPLVNIFSAGNTAVIKPSEKCHSTSKLIKKLTSKYFKKDVLLTVEGDYKQSIKLVEQNFDHIFFTGSTETGKSIMKLASKNLTPLTLELSGTNPVIIFKNANLEVAAKRIVWGKFFNSGQSCMAPNHIFIDKRIENDFIEKLKQCIVSFYGKDPIISENLSKLEKKHFSSTVEIIKRYKKEKRILYGGTFSKKKLKITPTILRTKLDEKDILQKELFSSILPVIGINDKESALKQINQTSKPLAIYLFGGNNKIHSQISRVTSSGTVCINDVMLPVLIPNLPFGGVGQSGIGKFHGEEGFRNFSNQKSITFKGFLFDLNLRYPPYKRIKKFLKFIFKI
ncbi:putative aldehyde dehydrogenase [Prochlorococcus marinus str. MIT 9312]|uniref:Aldehyde dehydrogenase n=1 Tax=Prochlorococcus marinus (strain MIT 9312) TaxID=74546 RepID=Q31CJ7_PROM9|nr:aldehyde dehydrogenase family protein [Prochlorococcus marinus]ABB49398.1 putative aldehyde dehydrogenase [Prochlorococcus marinus str. MIT 9312]KGG00837.1 Aldehyde dehydrogenase [Prochlorococcus marinus str. MIT 9311]